MEREPPSFWKTSTRIPDPLIRFARTHQLPVQLGEMSVQYVSDLGPPGGDRMILKTRSGNAPDSVPSAETFTAHSITLIRSKLTTAPRSSFLISSAPPPLRVDRPACHRHGAVGYACDE